MMNKRTAFAGVLALLLSVPFFASALTSEELAAQIKSILAQVAVLQQKLQAAQTIQTPANIPVRVGSSCPQLLRSLSMGMTGPDVLGLQRFLLSQSMITEEDVTGSFNLRTQSAIQFWQANRAIVSSGSPQTTGYGVVGPRTRADIALRCAAFQSSASGSSARTCPLAQPPLTLCSTGWRANTDSLGCVTSYKCSLPLPQMTPATSTIGACTAIALLCPLGTYDQVGPNCSHSCVAGVQPQSSAFFATPTSGAVPLLVTFALYAPDNSESGGIYYYVEFGDGQATIFSRTSSPSLLHTYASAGIYTATVTRKTGCTPSQCFGSSTGIGTTTIVVGATSGIPPFSISSPVSGQTVKQGEGLTISWDSQNAPTGSAVSLWLVKSSGGNLGLIARNQLTNGTFNWQVPGSRCSSSGVCSILVDSPAAYYTDVGTYWIVGNIYTPADAYLGGYGPANPTYPTYLATATSSLFNITGTSNSTTFSGSPTSGSAPLSVTFYSNTGGSIDFGDGSSGLMMPLTVLCAAGANCGGSSTYAYHTYTSSGTYTAKLLGPGCDPAPLGQVSCLSVRPILGTITITVGGVISSCPVYSPPLCNSSQHLVGGSYNSSTGCYGSPQCAAN